MTTPVEVAHPTQVEVATKAIRAYANATPFGPMVPDSECYKLAVAILTALAEHQGTHK